MQQNFCEKFGARGIWFSFSASDPKNDLKIALTRILRVKDFKGVRLFKTYMKIVIRWGHKKTKQNCIIFEGGSVWQILNRMMFFNMKIDKIFNRFASYDCKQSFEFYTWENFAMEVIKLSTVKQVTKWQFNCPYSKFFLCVMFEIMFKITEKRFCWYSVCRHKGKSDPPPLHS